MSKPRDAPLTKYQGANNSVTTTRGLGGSLRRTAVMFYPGGNCENKGLMQVKAQKKFGIKAARWSLGTAANTLTA